MSCSNDTISVCKKKNGKYIVRPPYHFLWIIKIIVILKQSLSISTTYLQKRKSVTYGNDDYTHSKWHYEITRNHQCVLLPPGNDVNQLSESDLSEVLK
jgi:hypothetical protein